MLFAIGLIALADIFSSAVNFQWQFKSSFGYCSAQQYLGVPERAIRIVRTPASENTMLVLFEDKPWPVSSRTDFADVLVRVGPTKAFLGSGAAGQATGKSTRFASVIVRDPTFLSTLSAASAIALSIPRAGEMSVTYRQGASLASLRECEDQKMSSWGIDPDTWHALRSPPLALDDFRNWLRPESHRLMLLPDPSGQPVIKFVVGVDGRATQCRGIDPAIIRELNQAACAGIEKRGRFSPARDRNDNPVPSPYVIVAEFQRAT